MPLSDGTILRVPFAVINPDGRIARIGESEISVLAAQASEVGQTVVAPVAEPGSDVIIADVGGIDDALHMWDFAEGEWINLPARPEDRHYWTGTAWAVFPPQPNAFCIFDEGAGAWTDPRSPADLAAALFQARLLAALTPGEMIYRLALAGAYPMSEIANSLVPATFDDFLALPAFDGALRTDIRAGLSHWATIPRAHSLLHGPIHPDDPGDGLPDFSTWLASARSITLTPANWDEIFDVAVPPPLYSPV